MDKYEYKIRANEIKQLIEQEQYAQAAEIADTIDWRRVKSVMMLCMISDLYKINRRYEDARDLLLLAYERRPGGRTICYSLCELSIKMEEYVQAIEYYKEYVQAAGSTKDVGRYILQYKLYEAQDVSLEERIAVLERLKQCEYREKWGYELAYLYHRIGLASRCVEECDELIVWFGDGKYVIKAMELKMLHQPLTPAQQKKYDHRFDALEIYQPVTEEPSREEAVSENAEAVNEQIAYNEPAAYNEPYVEPAQPEQVQYVTGDTQIYERVQIPFVAQAESVEPTTPAVPVVEEVPVEQPEEMDIYVKTMDVGQYNTMNLQAELAAGLREVLEAEQPKPTIEDPITRSIMAPMLESDTESLDGLAIEDVEEDDLEAESVVAEIASSEVFFGETGEISFMETEQAALNELNLSAEPVANEAAPEEAVAEESQQNEAVPDVTAEIVMEQLRQENTVGAIEPEIAMQLSEEPPKEIAHILSQEADGQIRLIMPERELIEKQITGQINIEDILAEWERIKKENQEKREEEIRMHVLQQTGPMFTEFEASVRDGLLEQLERDNGIEKDVAEVESIENTADEIDTDETYAEEAYTEEAYMGEEVITEADEVEELEEVEVPEEEYLVGDAENYEEAEIPEEEYIVEEDAETYEEAEAPEEEYIVEEDAETYEEVEAPEEEYIVEEDAETYEEAEVPEEEYIVEEDVQTYEDAEVPEEEFVTEEVESPEEEAYTEDFVVEEFEFVEDTEVPEEEPMAEAVGEPEEDFTVEEFSFEEEPEVEEVSVVEVLEVPEEVQEEAEELLVAEEATEEAVEEEPAIEELEPSEEVSEAEEMETSVETSEAEKIETSEETSEAEKAEKLETPEEAEVSAEEIEVEEFFFEEEPETVAETVTETEIQEETAKVEEFVVPEEVAGAEAVVEEFAIPEEVAEAEELVVAEEATEEAVEEEPAIEELEPSEEASEAEEIETSEEALEAEEFFFEEEPETIAETVTETEVQEETAEVEEFVVPEEVAGAEVEELAIPEEVTEAEEAEIPQETLILEEPEILEEEAPAASKAHPTVEQDKARVRSLTPEERELYGDFIQSRTSEEKLVKAIDNISLAAYTGNIIITGDEGVDTLPLAKSMIREMQVEDRNFSGVVAKTSGSMLNKKDVVDMLKQLRNGALIVTGASEMNAETVNTMYKALQHEREGIVVILLDTKRAIEKFLEKNPQLKTCFTARMDVEAPSNDKLVAFGKQYAEENEYGIDELGVLALHTKIESMQTIDHAVTTEDVKEIIDEAIDRVNKKTLGHFFDVLFAKRYDEEDRIVLSEKDFV